MELFDFVDNSLPTENRPLMKAIDQINQRFLRAIPVAATRFDKAWKSKAERVSQRYSTDLRELVCVK
jgi:DNA polymerase V